MPMNRVFYIWIASVGCLFSLVPMPQAQNPKRPAYLFPQSAPTREIAPGGVSVPNTQLFEGIAPLDAGENPIFVAPVAYGSGGYIASSVWVADVNHDGKLDLVVTNACNSTDECGNGNVSILLGNGDGTFQAAVAYNAGDSPTSVTVADVNADGKPDLIVSDGSGGSDGHGTVAILLGRGDGTFKAAVTYDAGGCNTSSVSVADLNRDGKLDIVLDSPACATNYDGIVGILLGNGDGSFQPVVSYDSGGDDQGSLSSVAVGDFNRDGKLDVVISNSCGTASCGLSTIGVLLGNGDGTLQTAVTSGLQVEGATSIAVVDLNADSKLDLVVAGSAYAVLLGNGDGTFQPWGTYSGGFSLKVADINGDGKPDLVGTGNSDGAQLNVLLGNGDGTFQSPMSLGIPSGGELLSVEIADLNGDLRPDVVVADSSGLMNPPCLYTCVDVLFNNLGPHTPTTTSLVSNSNPTILKSLLTYTATVTPQLGTATGTVTLKEVELKGGGSSTIATLPLINNQAAYNVPPALGLHSIIALYSGDLHNSVSTSPILQEWVEKPTTATAVTTSANPSYIGGPVNIVANVTAHSGEALTGSVTFKLKSLYAPLGTVALVNGQATLQYTFTVRGRNSIVAYYSGDGDQTPSISAAFNQVVGPAPTTIALSSNLNPAPDHQAVTFTALVTSVASLPLIGRVTFLDGTKIIGTGTISGGIATLKRSTLAPGSHSITATYDGDASSAKSTSAGLIQVVN
jgi:hypothetical protein